jgi:hypothetical protein
MSETELERERARKTIEAAMADASSTRFLQLLALGLLTFVPGAALAAMWLRAIATQPEVALRFRSDDVGILLVMAVLVVVGAASLVMALRSSGPRGTPAGKKLLDTPASCEAARYFVREITAGGAGLRTVHVVELSFDDASSFELHVDPRRTKTVLAALRAWLPASSHVDGGDSP